MRFESGQLFTAIQRAPRISWIPKLARGHDHQSLLVLVVRVDILVMMDFFGITSFWLICSCIGNQAL